MDYLAQLQELEDHVRENWVATDGGLTLAASDVLSTINAVRKNIKERRTGWATYEDMFNCDTGTEQEVLAIYFNWVDSL